MKKRIFDAVYKNAQMNNLSFHMPGHKGKTPEGFYAPEFMKPAGVFKLDTTEIPGMDNLYNAQGIIKNSQEYAAEIYGAAKSIFLTGGSTAGILAAILACVSDGDEILTARNCHRSVISGLILSGAKPVYVYPQIISGINIAGGISPESIEDALAANPGIRAVIIVSPTYEGIVSDIEKIAEITKKAGAYLIIDSAHGAHFPFSKRFPSHPVCADIVISGLHKTLPVFGQTALLNVYNAELIPKIDRALAAVQTSSPSYLFMCAADRFFSGQISGKYNFELYTENLMNFRNRLANLKNIKLLGGNLKGKFAVSDTDISRFVFLLKPGTEEAFANTLREKYRIEIEAAYDNYAVLISSVADNNEDLSYLAQAVIEIDANLGNSAAITGTNSNWQNSAAITETNSNWQNSAEAENSEQNSDNFKTGFSIPKAILTPRQAWNKPAVYVKTQECPGRTAADVILTYPPGIAVLCPGEVIDENAVMFLKKIAKKEVLCVREG
ncbi:MAG: aminotransferase class I/II-fold pyridoxal phosphate-dependent enzyme [Clostridiales bacterium]|jgi:arginine/lysine/ornithine decarboxylase|nr:aminotransferase class I/II-fold pyridoxal phosphate-dependent enzyme [Clostridiales bacterium]